MTTYHRSKSDIFGWRTTGRKKNKSVLYERYIIPQIGKETKIIDVGAGKFRYVDSLKSKGFNICGYEPSFLKTGSNSIDIKSIVNHIGEIERKIKENGLFDVCILEAVINSVENDSFENIVLTTCNSLLDANGALVTCTRNIKAVKAGKDCKKNFGDMARRLYYLDENGYSLSVKNGTAYKQKFHSVARYKALLEKYFNDVRAVAEEIGYIYCIARNPKQLSLTNVKAAIDEEFNIEYPNGYRHNKHSGLIAEILKRVGERANEEKT